jgi:MYXO-CTERM domain-containing protein
MFETCVRSSLAAATAFVALVGCVQPEAFDDETTFEVVGVPGTAAEPRGVFVRGLEHAAPEHFTPHALAAPKHRVVYMNRQGGTFTPGTSNSLTNRSSIVSYTSSIAPWDVSDEGWQEVMGCMRELWEPFDVEITDIDPGTTPHIESVVAGRPQDVGMGSGIGGVSPFDCGIIETSIVFTFARVYGSDYRSICETAAQEVAHSFGLDHEYMCSDPMTYLSGCGEKSFQPVAAPCGEYSARSCSCGGSTQNSVELLLAYNGPRPNDPDPEDPPPLDDVLDQGEGGADFDTEPDPVDPGPGDNDPLIGGCSSGGSGGGAWFLLLALGVLIGRRR